ncbi:LysR family transcriptional regulator [Pseudomonas sp. Bc-h]|jgi:DNA-binding transcriptional LysR family regulator|uniref:LysR family transcriptional regulator n=1 Tax=unclassified Pseudomonas TaxID=196821 RepID=UPI0009DA8FB4|nr:MULTISPECIES: LysR family transcriptional regulator [unclassified Pseudomonas]MDE1194449.1 LysR family transcriptional regulator [Pseudomonas sp.]OQR28259.1 LysR family transcriptional regulator [Pseudomonas sp. Bc-h]
MIRELKTFITVERLGTFVAAGNQIGLTQSAVSAQIRTLEKALGTTLFDRSGRSATLNAAGQRALPMAREIVELFERMAAPSADSGYYGELLIGAIATVQTGLLPAALVQLNTQAPTVEAKVVPGVSQTLLNSVDAGEIDLAILIRPPFALPKELSLEVIAREPFVLIAPTHIEGDDPLQLLRDNRFVRYDRHSFGGRQVTRFLREQKIETLPGLELDEVDAIVRMVEAGLGVSLVPRAGLWLERATHIRIIELGTLTFYRELALVMRHASRQLPLQRLFRECLTDRRSFKPTANDT